MTIALFLTEKTSFALWERAGFLARGVLNYNRLAAQCDRFYFVTYGDASELRYQSLFARNCVILYNPYGWMPMRLYGLLSPFIHRRSLRQADVFYSGQMQGAWSAVIAQYLFRKKFMLNCGYQWSQSAKNWYRGRTKRIAVYFIEWLTYRAADFIILSSQSAKEYVMRRYQILGYKIEVISNYINTDLFKPSAAERPSNNLIFIGRLEPEKNLFALLNAINGIDVKLTIIGKGGLGDVLKKYVRENNLTVEFLGVLPNEQLVNQLNKNAIFILPSLYEGNPKALLEAMACGLAVIGTYVAGIKEVLHHQENGFLCGTNANSIGEAIVAVLNDKNLRMNLGQNARQYVVENCDLDKKIKKEIKIFQKICQKK